MLTYIFDRIFKAKGIDKPYTFLTKAGFSDNFSSKVNNNNIKQISLEKLEKLCIALHCTPNDLLDWAPDHNLHSDKDHPLHNVTKSDRKLDMKNILHSSSLDEIEEIEDFIKEKRKAREENTQ